jgi:hypothetical protein
MIVTPTLQRLNRTQIDKPKGRSSKIQSDAEDELPDAPPRRAPREDDDIALHEAIANVLVSIPMGHRSRRLPHGPRAMIFASQTRTPMTKTTRITWVLRLHRSR